MKLFVLIGSGLGVVILILFFTAAPRYADRKFNTTVDAPPYPASEAAQKLHKRLLVADLHNDLLLWKRDPLKRYKRGHTDLPRLIEGNVALQTFSVVTKSPWGQNYQRTEGDSDRITLLAIAQAWPVRTWTSLKERALYQAQKLRDAVARSEGQLTLVRTVEDLDRFLARREREADLVAGLLALEGLHALEGDPDNLDVFFDAGYRMMAPTHLFDNALAGSSSGVAKGGLTALGRQVIRRMEEHGIIVDLAHASERTVDEVLDMATRPVVVSHTGVQATCDTPRNLNDRLIRRIADNAGVIGIGLWEKALCGTDPATVVRAMRHVADLVGVDHVALGSDFDGTTRTRFDATGLVQITEALLADGFTDDEIGKIMGGNVIRLLREGLPARHE